MKKGYRFELEIGPSVYARLAAADRAAIDAGTNAALVAAMRGLTRRQLAQVGAQLEKQFPGITTSAGDYKVKPGTNHMKVTLGKRPAPRKPGGDAGR